MSFDEPHTWNGVFDAIDAGLMILGADRCILGWNQWMTRATGVPATAALGRPLDEVFGGLIGPRLSEAVTDASWAGRMSRTRLTWLGGTDAPSESARAIDAAPARRAARPAPTFLRDRLLVPIRASSVGVGPGVRDPGFLPPKGRPDDSTRPTKRESAAR